MRGINWNAIEEATDLQMNGYKLAEFVDYGEFAIMIILQINLMVFPNLWSDFEWKAIFLCFPLQPKVINPSIFFSRIHCNQQYAFQERKQDATSMIKELFISQHCI